MEIVKKLPVYMASRYVNESPLTKREMEDFIDMLTDRECNYLQLLLHARFQDKAHQKGD